MSFLKFLDKIGACCTYVRNFFLNIFFFIFLGFLAITLLGCLVAISIPDTETTEIKNPNSPVIMISISGNVHDEPASNSMAQKLIDAINNVSPENYIFLQDLRKSVQKATNDKNIRAIVLKINSEANIRTSQIKALGKDLEAFKKAGKRIFVYADEYSKETYLLASFGDYIYVNPLGGVYIDGYRLGTLYYKDLLDNILVSVFTPKAGTHKSAVEPFNLNEMSPQIKEEYQGIADDLWGQYKDTVNSKRKDIDIQKSVFGTDEYTNDFLRKGGDAAKLALENKLVDKIATYNEFIEDFSTKAKIKTAIDSETYNKNLKAITWQDYLKKTPIKEDNATNAIAVVFGLGEISYSSEEVNAFTATNLIPQLNKIIKNKNIKAVVLYLNTPGGEVFASELIREKLIELKNSGKKIIVYMSEMTASGGFWVSSSADYLIAEPTSITGSIGVLAITGSAEKLAEKIGVHESGVSSPNTQPMSLFSPIPENIKVILQVGIMNTYEKFLSLVANNRKMPVDKLRPLAEGKIYTGKKALELGLIDELGDFDAAINKAEELAKLQKGSYKLIYSQPIVANELNQLSSLLVSAVAEVNKPAALKILNEIAPETKSIKLQGLDEKPKTISILPVYVK